MRTATSQEGDSLARLGGDEFTVLLSTIAQNEDAATVAERIRLSLAESLDINDQELFTTTSIGIAIFPEDGETAEELLKNADLAMYYAKHSGGNTFRYFSTKMTEVAQRRLTLENNLRKAIERDELDLHYQPQLDLITGNFCGVEALLRWDCKELGRIAPVEFIPLAEDTGLIISIGEWVLRKACHQAKNWQAQGLALSRIAVNVSVIQLLNKGFSSLLAAVLAETGLEPEALELELTESALISDEVTILAVLHKLKKIGVTLAIDDFGTGYSSLSRLKNFPIDCLKIDRSFVCEIEENLVNTSIVSALIAMAEGMNMKVIAEGVETEVQLAFLKEKQCNEVQGYLLSKPLLAKQIEEFIQQSYANK
jgi:diguanylate cyclase